MVGSIKNRIAAFENMAETSKTNSKLLAIVPPQSGFSGTKKFASPVSAKETYGNVKHPFKSISTHDQEKRYTESRGLQNKQFAADLGAYGNYKDSRHQREHGEAKENEPPQAAAVEIETIGTSGIVRAETQNAIPEPIKQKMAQVTKLEPEVIDHLNMIGTKISTSEIAGAVPAESTSNSQIYNIEDPRVKELSPTVTIPDISSGSIQMTSVPPQSNPLSQPIMAPELSELSPSSSGHIITYMASSSDQMASEPPQTNTSSQPIMAPELSELSPSSNNMPNKSINDANNTALTQTNPLNQPMMVPERSPSSDNMPNKSINDANNTTPLQMNPLIQPILAPESSLSSNNMPNESRNSTNNTRDVETDEFNSTHGPVSVVAVKSNEVNFYDDESEGRDELSISPLSFQGHKIEASTRDPSPYSNPESIMKIPVIPEEAPVQYGDFYSGRGGATFAPAQESLNSKRASLPDINFDDDESEENASKSGSTSIDLMSFSSGNKDVKDALYTSGVGHASNHNTDDGFIQGSNRNLSFGTETLGSGLSESQNGINQDKTIPLLAEHRIESIGGLPMIQDEYDNFTLGSGESGDFFNKGQGTDETGYDDFENAMYEQLVNNHLRESLDKNSNGTAVNNVYQHRNKGQHQAEQTNNSPIPLGGHIKKVDPLFLDDSSEDSKSHDKSEDNSFTDYVNNIQPVPSFERDDQKVPAEDVSDSNERTYAENLSKDVDSHTASMSQNSMSLFEEDKVVLASHNMNVREIEDNLLIPNIINNVQGNPKNNVALEYKHNKPGEEAQGYFDHFFQPNDAFDETQTSRHVVRSQGAGTHEAMSPLDIVERSHNVSSPVYYPEEDFIEDDFEEDCYDDETETTGTDLLGINFDELSMMSDGIESHFVNEGDGEPIYPAEYSVSTTGTPNSAKSQKVLSIEAFEVTQESIDGLKTKSSKRNQDLLGENEQIGAGEQIAYLPLASIQENEYPNFDDRNKIQEGKSSEHYSSAPAIAIRNASNLSQNDEFSQITELTYDMEQKLNKLQVIPSEQDQSVHESKSDQASLMTYSLAEDSSASIVKSAKKDDGPIFRDRNSLRDNATLKRRDSTISELSDPATTYGRKPSVPAKDKRTGHDSNHSIVSGNSSVPKPIKPPIKKSKKDPPRRRSPSPSFGRMGRQRQDNPVEDGRGRSRRKEWNNNGGKGTGKSKRSFSWRSLSPFRRRNSSRINKINDKSAFTLDQDEVRNSTVSVDRPKLNRDYSGGSTPSLILERDEARETTIPLVAITLSDDSSLKKKPKKGFSLRSLSPFRRHRGKKSRSKKRGKIDPFDEGQTSL